MRFNGAYQRIISWLNANCQSTDKILISEDLLRGKRRNLNQPGQQWQFLWREFIGLWSVVNVEMLGLRVKLQNSKEITTSILKTIILRTANTTLKNILKICV